jgi:putative hydrolase
MHVFADYHTHTTYSHGKGSIEQNVKAALDRGLSRVGISDHGPANIGIGTRLDDFPRIRKEIDEMNAKYDKIKVVQGIEANVISIDGELDVPMHVLKKLDMVMAGLHLLVKPASLSDGYQLFFKNQLGKLYRPLSEKARTTNTKALIEALYRYPIEVITHPGLRLDIDTCELSRAAAKKGVALEINASHGYLSDDYIKIALRQGASFMIGSDAHRPEDVGRLENGVSAAKRCGVPPERILNAH